MYQSFSRFFRTLQNAEKKSYLFHVDIKTKSVWLQFEILLPLCVCICHSGVRGGTKGLVGGVSWPCDEALWWRTAGAQPGGTTTPGSTPPRRGAQRRPGLAGHVTKTTHTKATLGYPECKATKGSEYEEVGGDGVKVQNGDWRRRQGRRRTDGEKDEWSYWWWLGGSEQQQMDGVEKYIVEYMENMLLYCLCK